MSAAAAAKSLQSCPTLCDPIDGSPRALVAQLVKNLPAMQETLVPFLGLENLCFKVLLTLIHSIIQQVFLRAHYVPEGH